MLAVPHPDLSPLVGSWRLLSHGWTFCDTGERFEPFGPNPDGRMVLEPEGRIMFLFATPNRQQAADEAGRAALFEQMAAYTGIARANGPGRFTTTIDLASHPAWGGEQLRFFTVDGNRLIITTPQQTHPLFPGRLLVGDVIFTREHPEP